MSYIAFFAVLIVAFYTILYSLEILKEKNYSGFIAIIFLAIITVTLPFYFLFLKS